jgi:hypothetical protein
VRRSAWLEAVRAALFAGKTSRIPRPRGTTSVTVTEAEYRWLEGLVEERLGPRHRPIFPPIYHMDARGRETLSISGLVERLAEPPSGAAGRSGVQGRAVRCLLAVLVTLQICCTTAPHQPTDSANARSSPPGGATRYYQGSWTMSATVTQGKFWTYIAGTLERSLSTTQGLLLIGTGKLGNEKLKVAPLAWHHFGYLATTDLCVGQAGLLKMSPPVVGLVSLFWRRGWAGPFIPPGVPLGGGAADTRMHYTLSVPRWLTGITIRWQALLDDGKGSFWESDAWEFLVQ